MAFSRSQHLRKQMSSWSHQEADRLVCDLCPRRCRLPDGARGFCFVRQNVGGEMLLTTYGKSTGFCIDPIEKKPLNHFYPGTPVLSFGTAGCNLGCKFCQNWDISKSRQVEILSASASPEKIVECAEQMGCRSIAYTYNDPVIWAEYAIDTARLARERGIKNVAVTAGYITQEARRDFFRYMDAANVDLKAFSEKFYHQIALAELKPILETLVWIKNESDVWLEITNLSIPGENDSEDEIRQMCDWIVGNLGPEVPLHFTAFHPDYRMQNKSRTQAATLLREREQAHASGLHYVYTGNIHHPESQGTYCPNCRLCVIERDGYKLGNFLLEHGRCQRCSEKIPGFFEKSCGTWGAKREQIVIENTSRKEPRVSFNAAEQSELVSFVNSLILTALRGDASAVSLSSELKDSLAFGAFLTLKRGTLLRACRGRWGGAELSRLGDLLENVVFDTVRSDPRFPGICATEIPFLGFEVSLMHDAKVLTGPGEERLQSVHVGVHGLVIQHPEGRGLLLPQVAVEYGWTAKEFLERTCEKAGLPKNYWKADEATVLTFQCVILHSPPPKIEFSLEVAGKTFLETLRAEACALQKSEGRVEREGRRPELKNKRVPFTTIFAGRMGLELLTRAGIRVVRFGENLSLHELLELAFKELYAIDHAWSVGGDSVQTLTLFVQPITLSPFDEPERFRTVMNDVWVAERSSPGSSNGTVERVIISPHNATREERLADLRSISDNATADWRAGILVISSYRTYVCKLEDTPLTTMEETKIQSTQKKVREAVFSGKFYPALPSDREKVLNEFLKAGTIEKKAFAALMLPHAGWRYCGEVIGATLDGVLLPKEIIILGPKHTRIGARCSIAAHEAWAYPGFEIPILSAGREFLLRELPFLESDTAAHAEEHGSEVLVPFFHFLNPAIHILPIALGACTEDEIQALSGVLAAFLRHRLEAVHELPLLVISTDMNHFDTESVGRKKDSLALEMLEDGDGEALRRVCGEREISMCGVIPAAVILGVLRRVFKPFQFELCAYQTSAKYSGNIDSVVGYAGARWRTFR